MSTNEGKPISRRLLAGAAALGALVKAGEQDVGAQTAAAPVNRNSAPSDLRITDMRACRVASSLDWPIIRIDTNQGVYGLGEVRDAAVEGIALVLKPHLAGRNPLNIEPLLDSVRKYSNHLHLGGGYSAVDIALHDIAGKVYGVPCWRLLGSKYRERVRVYCHLPSMNDPQAFAEGVKKRKAIGFTMFKTSWAANLVANVPGAVNVDGIATDRGLKLMCERLDKIRDVIGWDAQLALDHLGTRLRVKDCIRYLKALEPYNLIWAEDVLPALAGEPGAGGNIVRDWARYKEVKEAHHHADRFGRGHFRPGGRLYELHRQPGHGYRAYRAADGRRDEGDEEDRGLRGAAGHPDRDPLLRVPRGRRGELTCRRDHPRFHRHGAGQRHL